MLTRRRPLPATVTPLACTLALALALLAAGCTAVSTTTTDTTAPPATTAPPTTQDKKTDEKVAKKALLTIDDFSGDGWTEGEDRTDSDDASESDWSNECPDVQQEIDAFDALTADAPKSKSPEFENKRRGLYVTEDIIVLATEDDATTVANVVGSDAFEECLPKVLEGPLARGGRVTVTGLEVSRTRVGPLGDDHGVFTLNVSLEAGGQSADVTAVFGFIRVERAYAYVAYTAVGELDVKEDVMPIFEASVDKLRRNLDV